MQKETSKTKILETEPVNAANSIGYQADSIAKRDIIKTTAYTVTVFAFDKGEEMARESAPHDTLAHVLEGDADFIIQGVTHSVQGGEIIYLPAHRPYALKAVRRLKIMLTTIHP